MRQPRTFPADEHPSHEPSTDALEPVMTLPTDLRYAPSHEWVRTEPDGSLLVGITDFAQDALGDLVYLELPEPGRTYAAQQVIAVVESVKAASDIYAPVAGSVLEVNEALKNKPEELNRDAFAAWLFRLRPQDAGDVARLLDAAAYQRQRIPTNSWRATSARTRSRSTPCSPNSGMRVSTNWCRRSCRPRSA
jgi:glycine cleavage system H protein